MLTLVDGRTCNACCGCVCLSHRPFPCLSFALLILMASPAPQPVDRQYRYTRRRRVRKTTCVFQRSTVVVLSLETRWYID